LSKKNIFQGKSDFIEIPKLHSQDIDNHEDWQIAKTLWKLKNIK
jgi:CMP-N-acetylneuraminic acid synthetase